MGCSLDISLFSTIAIPVKTEAIARKLKAVWTPAGGLFFRKYKPKAIAPIPEKT